MVMGLYLATESGTSGRARTEAMGNVCGNCTGRTLGECVRCIDCGFVAKGNFGKCVAGDLYGPSERREEYAGARWISHDPFWTSVLVSDNIVRPAPRISPT